MLGTPETIGPYRVLGLLGRGGMGVVYRGEHLVSGERVAVKTVHAANEGVLGGIRREIGALARIRHPGIVHILDQGQSDGVPWYAMELLDGLSLRQRCKQLAVARSGSGDWWTLTLDPGPPDERDVSASKPTGVLHWVSQQVEPGAARESRPVARALLPSAGGELSEVLGLVRRLCETLAFLHGEGIIHRDLKPENVLVRPDGEPVLVDFGLAAKWGGELSREVLEVDALSSGSVGYVAPEQIEGRFVDARADLYALGCLLYELVTGRLPFTGATRARILKQHLEAEPMPPSQLAEGVPQALDDLMLRLLRKEPRERIGYASDVAAALERLGAKGAYQSRQTPRVRPYLYRPGFGGRDQELQWLVRHLEKLDADRGGLVLIGGESGIGKTRLTMELTRKAAARGTPVLVGESLPPSQQGGGGALQPLRKPLQAIADTCRERGIEETERVLGRRGPVLAVYEPALAGLPGQSQYPVPAELPAEAARERIHDQLVETLVAFGKMRSLLLVLDDLQWADDLTLGFVQHVLRSDRLGNEPVLLVGTYRTEELNPRLRELVDAVAEVSRLELRRLDRPAVGAIVEDMLALQSPAPGFSEVLTEHSEGNPFFAAEYLRAAVSEGLLWRDELGRWQIAEPGGKPATRATYEALPLPRSLRDLVSRRLAGLPAKAQSLMEGVAVLGRESLLAVAQRVARLEDRELDEALLELDRRQALEISVNGQLRFHHDKIREVAYEAISGPGRTDLHKRAAEAIEDLLADALEDHLAPLAGHWERAGNDRAAQSRYLGAARQATARFAHEDAERLYRAALRLSDGPAPDTIAAHNELGEAVLRHQGRTAEAHSEHEQAVAEAKQLGSRDLEVESLRALGDTCYEDGRPQEALRWHQRALELVRGAGDDRREGRVLVSFANLLSDQGEMEQAREMYEEALRLHRRTGDLRLEANTLNALAGLYREQGRVQDAQQLYEQSLTIVRQAGDRHKEGVVLNNLASVRSALGKFEEAERLFDEALALHQKTGHRRYESIAMVNLGAVNVKRGELQAARVRFESSLQISRSIGDRLEEGRTLGRLADLELIQTGDLRRADALATQAEAILAVAASKVDLGKVISFRGHIAVAEGRSAREFLKQLQSLAEGIGAGPGSELDRATCKLRGAVDAFEAGEHHRLFRGILLEDFTDGQRSWLEETGQLAPRTSPPDPRH